MLRHMIASLMTVSLLGAVPVLVGCDETLSHKETVKTNSEGDVSKSERTVKEKSDGTIVKEESKTVKDN